VVSRGRRRCGCSRLPGDVAEDAQIFLDGHVVAAGAATRLGFVSLTQSAGSVAANCLFSCTITAATSAATAYTSATITVSR
jgi:hypothetical protein